MSPSGQKQPLSSLAAQWLLSASSGHVLCNKSPAAVDGA
jgi:hypothetical protein